MSPLERMNSEYRSGKGKYVKVEASDLAMALNLIDAAIIIDRTFEKAGVTGIIADFGPVADAVKSLTTQPEAEAT